jgi:hypothetical protein
MKRWPSLVIASGDASMAKNASSLKVGKPRVTAAVFQMAEPCTYRIQDKCDGDAYGIDGRQRVTPAGEMSRKHEIRSDPKAPIGPG